MDAVAKLTHILVLKIITKPDGSVYVCGLRVFVVMALVH